MSKEREIEETLFASINCLYENSVSTEEWDSKGTSQLKVEMIFFCYFENKKGRLFFICDAV